MTTTTRGIFTPQITTTKRKLLDVLISFAI